MGVSNKDSKLPLQLYFRFEWPTSLKYTSRIVHISEFHFYDLEWTEYATELENHSLLNKKFSYIIASWLFDKYLFLEHIDPDICQHANLTHMASLLDEEAEK